MICLSPAPIMITSLTFLIGRFGVSKFKDFVISYFTTPTGIDWTLVSEWVLYSYLADWVGRGIIRYWGFQTFEEADNINMFYSNDNTKPSTKVVMMRRSKIIGGLIAGFLCSPYMHWSTDLAIFAVFGWALYDSSKLL